MTITAETMAASKAEPKPRVPTDYRGNSVHVGGIYTSVSVDSLTVFRVDAVNSQPRGRVTCTVLWPVHSGMEPRAVHTCDLIRLDLAMVARQWQELGMFLQELAPAPEDDEDV